MHNAAWESSESHESLEFHIDAGAEIHLLACLNDQFLEPDVARQVFARVKPEDFYSPGRGDLFRICKAGWQKSGGWDPVYVHSTILAEPDPMRRRNLEDAEREYLNVPPSDLHLIERRIDAILQAAQNRRTARAARLLMDRAARGELTPADLRDAARNIERTGEATEIIGAGELVQKYNELRPVVIENILREGEVSNLIASPKMGKTWLSMAMGLAVASGRKWLGYQTARSRVLVVDNELHLETIGVRLQKVAAAMGLEREDYAGNLDYLSLRGAKGRDIHALKSRLGAFEPGRYKLIVLDAVYRLLPRGVDENSNSDMTDFMGELDELAKNMGAAVVGVHHTSKGLQSGKAVTDVGAGAGAMSRATDMHLVLIPHEEDGAAVLYAAPRSFPQREPKCLRFEYPLWKDAPDLNPEDVRKTARGRKPDAPPPPKPETEFQWTTVTFAQKFLGDVPQTLATLTVKAEEVDPEVSEYMVRKLLNKAVAVGLAHRWSCGPKGQLQWAKVPQPDLTQKGT